MVRKTLLFAALSLSAALPAAHSAGAQMYVNGQNINNQSVGQIVKSQSNVQNGRASVAASQMSQDDAAYLSQMSAKDFPGNTGNTGASGVPSTDNLQDLNHDGVVDGSDLAISIGAPYAAQDAKDAQAAPKVQYVYKPPASYELSRQIQDDRINDSYVQGLLRQGGGAQ
ncbi:MAG: hypothetical protein H6865_00370 [Rhodospirillales bacterium]|nr:hypothetical protein [Alphaproteobacteria bacterium]MCB9986080.1 hypothetical protein [Rhodospirillales bacterium]USO07353.1 MAG: hypothetical protein H6866_08005 [Rhodospirillales bacterium]